MSDFKRLNHILYYMAVFVTNIGNSCAFIILGKYSLDIFGLASVFGAILLLEQVKGLSLSYIGGRLTEKFGAKSVAVACDGFLFISGCSLGVFALYENERVAIVAVALLINLAKPLYSPALFVFVREITSQTEIRAINSKAAAFQQIGWITGLAIAALGLTAISLGGMIILDSVTYLCSAGFLLLCRSTNKFQESTGAEQISFWSQWRTLASVLRAESFVWMLVIAVQVNLIVSYNIALFKLVAKVFPAHSNYLSLFEVIFALSVVIGALRSGRGMSLKTIGPAYIVQATIFLLLPIADTVMGAVILVAMFGFLGAHIFPMAFERLYYVTQNINSARTGAAKGIVQSAIAIPILVGTSALLDSVGLFSAYFMMAVISGALGLWLMVSPNKKAVEL